MRTRILLSILLLIVSLISNAQSTQPDMTVFGYKLGEKLPIPECPCKVVEWNEGTAKGFLSNKRYKGYEYTTGIGNPAINTCFERKDVKMKYKVKRNEQLNPLPPVIDEFITVRFASKDAPSRDICPTGTFDAKIENGKLTSVFFDIYSGDADNVFETLKQKYGTKDIAVKNYQIQNGYGATLNYYVAAWGFPNLWVVLTSSLHRSLSEQFGNVMIGFPIKNEAPKSNRAL